MSESPREYILHMLDEIDYVLSQLPGTDFDAFYSDPTLKRAFVRSLEIIVKPRKISRKNNDQKGRILIGERLRGCGIN